MLGAEFKGRLISDGLPSQIATTLKTQTLMSDCSQKIEELFIEYSLCNPRWTKISRLPVKKVDAGDPDDGLPCRFLAGPVIEVWLALHLNWA